MQDWLRERVKLGRTDLMAGRLGLGSSYMAPAEAWEEAFDAGCNYFYWGAFRTKAMTRAIRNLVSRGKRDEMIVVIQSYIRPGGIEWSLMRGLKKLGIDHTDVLLLGWYNHPPHPKTMENLARMKERGIFRYLGISGHHRPLFARLAGDRRFDLFMIRYNAGNRGAEKDVFPHLKEDRQGIVAFTATRHMTLVKTGKLPPGEKRPSPGDCYRFVLTNPHVDVVITGPSNMGQMRENLFEVAKGPLSAREMEWMGRIGKSVISR